MTTDLDRLIDAVEAGTLTETECLSNGNRLPMCATMWDAFSGSVDAAITLCEVLLPRWSAVIQTNGGAQIIGPNFRRFHGKCQDKPARALLLAVLRARLMELEMSERNELVARLNRADEYEPLGHDGWVAADQIERDGRENERLRKALIAITDQKNAAERFTGADYDFEYGFDMCIALARAALNKETNQ